MALFVQIDHFRKTDQKPTVKNHLFSISWFRSFNRTSFQQQLKLPDSEAVPVIVTLQSYILSTTTETQGIQDVAGEHQGFNRTSFQQQLKRKIKKRMVVTLISFNRTSFQQQLKLRCSLRSCAWSRRFNRTSFQQQLKQSHRPTLTVQYFASIVHPFNNN